MPLPNYRIPQTFIILTLNTFLRQLEILSSNDRRMQFFHSLRRVAAEFAAIIPRDDENSSKKTTETFRLNVVLKLHKRIRQLKFPPCLLATKIST